MAEEKLPGIDKDLIKKFGIPTFPGDTAIYSFKPDNLFEMKIFHIDRAIVQALQNKDINAYSFLVNELANAILERFPEYEDDIKNIFDEADKKFKREINTAKLKGDQDSLLQAIFMKFNHIERGLRKFLGERKPREIIAERLPLD